MGVKYKGGGKILQISPFISEMVQERASYYGTLIEVTGSRSIWTLSDPDRRGMRGQNFLADVHNYVCTV